ncbi:MAG: sigma-54 factor interaction domain-containing protein, partial [Desulfobacterales bacterium]|nr:sigma-54 factor interaction domain-containing protein [Desulfobacterales bacterium]
MVGSQAHFTFNSIIGKSTAIRDVKKLARVAARGTASVLLYGATGTGKELFAQAIHNAGPRRDKPFVVINCGAIPRELLESELFGYMEGAFTGAQKGGRPGKFELADGGTLFLDEIGDMPMDMQVKILRALQSGEIYRVGGSYP